MSLGSRPWPRLLAGLAIALSAPIGSPAAAVSPAAPTYSIDYHVWISARRPSTARVRWKLAGITEISRMRLVFDRDRFRGFRGTGTFQTSDRGVVWKPGGPYAHLEYRVKLRHRRRPGEGFDSYSTSSWVITRAQALFPRTHVTFRKRIERSPASRSRVHFHLPRGWQVFSAMDEIAPGSFEPWRLGRRMDRPKGWLAIGRLRIDERSVGATRVIVARPPSSDLKALRLLALYERTLLTFADLFGNAPAKLLIVSGPNPMWQGGLSGERSIYIHGDRPLRTPDRTSPSLHELFHVLAPFRPGADARWVTEGLAEYYSLELQSRAGLIRDQDRRRGLRLFERYGRWNVDLTAERSLEATNNSAPLVVAAIDHAIRRRSQKRKSLDDAVRALAAQGGRISTADFLRAVSRAAGRDLTPFFQRHVYGGKRPELPELAAGRRRTSRGARGPDQKMLPIVKWISPADSPRRRSSFTP